MEIRTQAELDIEAARFAGRLLPHPGGATLVTLTGELGAGKTAFAQAIAKALGVEDDVTSPTFVLQKIYLVKPQSGHEAGGSPRAAAGGFTRLVHMDAYRLEDAAELVPLGFDGLMRNPDNLILLEWPEHVGLVDAAVAITLIAHPDGSRTLKYA